MPEPVPVPTPTPPVPIEPNMQPVTSDDLGKYIDIASLSLNISVAIVAVLALVIASVTFLGVRELSSLRRRQNELDLALKDANAAKAQLTDQLKKFNDEFGNLVMAAHLFTQGENSYAEADYARAISFYERALSIQPSNARIDARLGRALVNKGLLTRAERVLLRAAAESPENSEVWRALATCKRYVDRPAALESISKALDYSPKNGDNWNYYGLLLRDEGKVEEALSAHREAERLDPTDPVAYFYQALLLIRHGRSSDARFKFVEAYAKVQAVLATNQIKPMWASTIEWAYRKDMNTSTEEVLAQNIVGDLGVACREERDRKAVLGHIAYYLHATGEDIRNDTHIGSTFPGNEIAEAASRIA